MRVWSVERSKLMTASVSIVRIARNLDNKSLIEPQLWDRLTRKIALDQKIEITLAQRIMDQALGFLRVCAEYPDQAFSPAPLVDIGWHAFILYSREYAAFCEHVAGRFIHHCPNDDPARPGEGGTTATTVAAMTALSVSVDRELWTLNGEDSSGRCGDDICRGIGKSK